MNLEFQPVSNNLEPCLELMRAYYEFDGIDFDPIRARRALEQMLREDHGRAWTVHLEGQTCRVRGDPLGVQPRIRRAGARG
jgi:hypothetical protein